VKLNITRVVSSVSEKGKSRACDVMRLLVAVRCVGGKLRPPVWGCWDLSAWSGPEESAQGSLGRWTRMRSNKVVYLRHTACLLIPAGSSAPFRGALAPSPACSYSQGLQLAMAIRNGTASAFAVRTHVIMRTPAHRGTLLSCVFHLRYTAG